MFLKIFLFCLIGVPFIQCKQLHEYMTPDEVMSVFHTPHHLVPEYEVVPVQHRLAKRENSDEGSVKMHAFQEDIAMYLHPTEGNLANLDTPVWTVESDPQSPEGVKYTQIPGAMRFLGVPFQDVQGASAVVISPTSNGQVHMDGVIKNSYVIKSLPQRILDDVAYGGHNLLEPHHTNNVTSDDDYAYTHHHVVYKIPPLKGDQYKDFNISDPEGEKRDAPEVIYPEMLVIIDNKEYKLLGGNIEQAVKYQCAFWNGVDLRYRLLNTPRMRFNIAGIVIALDDNALPCLENNRVQSDFVESDNALRCMARYLYREERFPSYFYDMAIVMTQLDMCNMATEDFCNPSTLGYAFVAGACDRNDTRQFSEAVGIVEDNGGFSGIIPTAHEIGHLIGARHDGNPNHAAECAPHDGFIMTNGLLLHENGFEWSSCSIDAFYTFINEDRAKCLYNKPKSGQSVPRLLPGKLLSLDEQCQMVGGTPACKEMHNVCIRLECQYPGFDGFCRAVAPAAEGSPCGEGLICLNGKCVLEGIMTKEQEKNLTEEQRKHLPVFMEQKIQEVPWIRDILKRLKERHMKAKKFFEDHFQKHMDGVKDFMGSAKKGLEEASKDIKNHVEKRTKDVSKGVRDFLKKFI